MTIRTKVLAAILSLVFLMVGGASFSLYCLLYLGGFRELTIHSRAETVALMELRGAIRSEVLETFDYILNTGSGDPVAALQAARARTATALAIYASRVDEENFDAYHPPAARGLVDERQELKEIRGRYAQLQARLEHAVALKDQGDLSGAKAELLRAKHDEFENSIKTYLVGIVAAEEHDMTEADGMIERRANLLRAGSMVLVLLACVIAALFVFWVFRSITRRLDVLQREMASIGRGDFSAVSPLPGSDELSELSRTLVVMAGALERANADVLESSRAYRQFVENTTEGIWAVDRENRTTFANPRMCRLLGYEPGELDGRHLDEFMDAEGRDVRDEEMRKLAASGSSRIEFTFRKKDGSPLHTMISATSILDSGGWFAGATALITDISEQRHAEERFRQVQKMEAVGQLAGGIAHDFNNILGVILMQVDLLLDLEPCQGAGPLAEGIGEIRDSAERAAALTRQLLVFSRKQRVEPKKIALGPVVMDLSRMIRRLVGEDITLSLDLGPDLGHVMADTSQLQQVVMNLVVNACDAMPRGGSLRISTRRTSPDDHEDADFHDVSAPHACLTVADTGHGMDEAVRGRIFEPFFTTKGVGKGTGLGLATVFGIVEQCGGKVTVQSAPGQGSTFRVYLPLVAAGEDAATLAETVAQAGAADGARILLIEDEAALRDVTCSALVGHGYSVETAENGSDALARYTDQLRGFDLVITDVVMPQMNGPDFVERARKIAGPRMNVLFVTGFAGGKLEAQGILPWGGNFMEKPYTVNELLSRVSSLLQSRRTA